MARRVALGSRPADAKPPPAACRCSSRPRTPGSPPSTDAAWASATRAVAARRLVRCGTSSRARSRAPGTSRSASACPCRSATSRSSSEPRPRKEPAMPTPTTNLTPEQLEAFGQELDAIRARIVADLGERDADYIKKVIRAQRGLEVAGRGMLSLGLLPPAWIGGTAALSFSKILDNMEIGHHVMHRQYDWMKDPRLNGKTFEWDTACPGDQSRHWHTYTHATHTNRD